MAKEQATESARDRVPPPPRMTGVGLSQIAMFSTLVAVGMAFLGVFLATSGADPALKRQADTLGAAIAAALSAPEPDWWAQNHGTWIEAWKVATDPFPKEATWPTIPKKTRERLRVTDHQLNQRNKKRLGHVEIALGTLAQGALRGMQIKFSRKGLNDLSAGARINPANFRPTTQVKAGVWAGDVVAADAMGSKSFAARVYRREYKDARGAKVGDVYVILSKAALEESKGGGMWLFVTPLLVGLALIGVLLSANKSGEGMKSLARDLDAIGRGKLDQRVHVGGSGEVGYAQRTAERMAKNLQLIHTTGASDIDEAVGRELDLAAQIHQSLRPSEPPRVPGFEVETLFKGGREIGGDYFDYIELDETRLALILADCSESLRGVPAAMVMAMTRAYLKASVDASQSPVEWLKWVNRRLARDLQSGMAVTALVAVVDTAKGEIVAASAGHRPIVMWRAGKTALINPGGIALGLDIGPVFDKTIEEKRFTMQKNDRIVLYTDGVISAENDAGEAYGEERFMESVRKQGAMNSAAFVNFAAGAVDKFLGGAEQPDDITICTLKKMK